MPLRHLRRHRHLFIKLQTTRINRHKWVLVLSTKLPSLVSSSDSTCSCTHHTKFDAGHVQTQHGVRSPQSVHVRRNNMELLNLDQCLHPQSRFQKVFSLQKNKVPDEVAAFVSGDCAGKQLWAIPTLAIGLAPHREGRKPPDCCFACIEHNS